MDVPRYQQILPQAALRLRLCLLGLLAGCLLAAVQVDGQVIPSGIQQQRRRQQVTDDSGSTGGAVRDLWCWNYDPTSHCGPSYWHLLRPSTSGTSSTASSSPTTDDPEDTASNDNGYGDHAGTSVSGEGDFLDCLLAGPTQSPIDVTSIHLDSDTCDQSTLYAPGVGIDRRSMGDFKTNDIVGERTLLADRKEFRFRPVMPLTMRQLAGTFTTTTTTPDATSSSSSPSDHLELDYVSHHSPSEHTFGGTAHDVEMQFFFTLPPSFGSSGGGGGVASQPFVGTNQSASDTNVLEDVGSASDGEVVGLAGYNGNATLTFRELVRSQIGPATGQGEAPSPVVLVMSLFGDADGGYNGHLAALLDGVPSAPTTSSAERDGTTRLPVLEFADGNISCEEVTGNNNSTFSDPNTTTSRAGGNKSMNGSTPNEKKQFLAAIALRSLQGEGGGELAPTSAECSDILRGVYGVMPNGNGVEDGSSVSSSPGQERGEDDAGSNSNETTTSSSGGGGGGGNTTHNTSNVSSSVDWTWTGNHSAADGSNSSHNGSSSPGSTSSSASSASGSSSFSNAKDVDPLLVQLHQWCRLHTNDPLRWQTNRPVSIPAMLPAKPSYYSYRGSMSRPPCGGYVNRILLKEPMSMTTQQLARIREQVLGLSVGSRTVASNTTTTRVNNASMSVNESFGSATNTSGRGSGGNLSETNTEKFCGMLRRRMEEDARPALSQVRLSPSAAVGVAVGVETNSRPATGWIPPVLSNGTVGSSSTSTSPSEAYDWSAPCVSYYEAGQRTTLFVADDSGATAVSVASSDWSSHPAVETTAMLRYWVELFDIYLVKPSDEFGLLAGMGLFFALVCIVGITPYLVLVLYSRLRAGRAYLVRLERDGSPGSPGATSPGGGSGSGAESGPKSAAAAKYQLVGSIDGSVASGTYATENST